MKHKAFTLAEVLITLGIIGVVAAFTIPSLLTNFQKRETITRLKAAYSILNQAIKLSEYDNGEIESWDYTLSPADWVDKYIRNYAKISDINSRTVKQSERWKLLDGTLLNWGSGMYTNPKYSLINGVWVSFYINKYSGTVNYRKQGVWIIVDVNGNTGPNRMGRDVFVMSIFPYAYPDEKIVMGAHEQCGSGTLHRQMTKREQLLNSGCATCKKDKSGWGFGCSRLIQLDNWRIAPDYPWIR